MRSVEGESVIDHVDGEPRPLDAGAGHPHAMKHALPAISVGTPLIKSKHSEEVFKVGYLA